MLESCSRQTFSRWPSGVRQQRIDCRGSGHDFVALQNLNINNINDFGPSSLDRHTLLLTEHSNHPLGN